MVFGGGHDGGTGGSARASRSLRLGIYIPTSGVAGLWGPSCRAAAELALAELNNNGGIDGQEVRISLVDAGLSPVDVAQRAAGQLADDEIDAIVGMHTSDVRQALVRAVDGRVPYIYTPLYEGGAPEPGVFCIGETPEQQLLPGLDWLTGRYDLKRWYLIGNDYVWPRRTHALAARHLRGRRVQVVGDTYLPFGTADMSGVVEALASLKPDGVLVSLVGDDAVRFNRAFARAGLDQRAIRFSCAIEENMLMAIGQSATHGLFAAAGYFSQLNEAANGSFLERYYGHHGDRAPAMNAIGQSVYEGVHFLNQLLAGGDNWRRPGRAIRPGGMRHTEWTSARQSVQPTFLAEAQGYDFRIVQRFAPSQDFC